MRSGWKANLWKIVLFPAIAGLIAIGYSLMQGSLHRWLGFDAQGHRLDGTNPPAAKSRSPIRPGDVFAALRADLDRAEPQVQPRRRYLTLVHRYNEPSVTEADLELERRAAAVLVAALAPPDQVAGLTAIDSERTIFRLDLAALGWSAEQWRQLVVLYPYGLSREDDPDEAIRAACKTIQSKTGDRVPALRADWFVVALSRPPLGGPGGSLGLWTKGPPEKVQSLLRDYAGQPLDLAGAAHEVGVDVEALRRLLENEAYLREEFGLAPLLAGKTIPRDAWESDRNLTSPFQELSKRLGLGKPIHLR